MARTLKTVRVDPELLERLDEFARDRLVPVTFAEQVDTALRLLVAQVEDQQLRHAADLVAADRQRAERTHRQTQTPR